jgi:hypothetical protein
MVKTAFNTANATLTAGAGNQTFAGPDITSANFVLAFVRFNNSSGALTVAAQCAIQLSADGTNWYQLGAPLMDVTTNAAITDYVIDIPPTARNIQYVCGSNTGNNCAIRIDTIVGV